MLGGGYVVASEDSLRTSSFRMNGLHGAARFLAPLALDPSDSARIFTATADGIFRTVDGGAHWALVGAGNDVVSLAVSPLDPAWVWAQERSSGRVRVSQDGGDTWAERQAASASGIGGTKILADPAAADAAFCTYLHHPTYSTRVLHTRDGGTTWTDVTGNLVDQAVNTIAVDPTRPLDWYAGTGEGVWYSGSGGASWRPYGRELPHVQILDLEFYDQGPPRLLLAATHGRGLWRVLPMEGFTASPRPNVRLELASRNPGRDSFRFRYAVLGGKAARLLVFDAAGRRVADLGSTASDGAERIVTWAGSTHPTGIYFVQLRSGSRAVTRKVILLR
jgi:photosystem II stability/assembly factor-like uncharacterized protein